MNTQENNKLIAEFMGRPTMIWNDPDPIEGNDYRVVYFKQLCDRTALIQYGKGEYNSEAEVFLTELEDIELKYHTSWDWLMPVINKIRSMDSTYEVEQVGKYDWDNEISHYEFDLDLTYESVVEFIKQLNK